MLFKKKSKTYHSISRVTYITDVPYSPIFEPQWDSSNIKYNEEFIEIISKLPVNTVF